MSLYKRCFAIGFDACQAILEANGVGCSNVEPYVELAEAIEYEEIDEIELITAESGN